MCLIYQLIKHSQTHATMMTSLWRLSLLLVNLLWLVFCPSIFVTVVLVWYYLVVVVTVQHALLGFYIHYFFFWIALVCFFAEPSVCILFIPRNSIPCDYTGYVVAYMDSITPEFQEFVSMDQSVSGLCNKVVLFIPGEVGWYKAQSVN